MHPRLFPYQKTGAEWLAARSAGILADEMGIGKTAQAIGAADLAGVQTAIVLCPGIARENWRREFMQWQTRHRHVEVIRSADELFSLRAMCADVLVMAYTILSNEKVRLAIGRMKVDALICDEAHALKEPGSIRSRAVYNHKFDRRRGVASRAARVWLLTGTPTPNHPGELWTHIRALWPDELAPICGLRRDDFVDHFCAKDEAGRIVGARRVPQLLSLVRPHVLRRLQAEVQPELPELRWSHVTVRPDALPPMPEGMAEAAQVIESAIATASGDDEAMSLVEADKMHLATLRRWTGVAKAPAVVEVLRSDIEAGNGPLVVFAIHREVMETIAAGVSGARILNGSTKPDERQQLIDDFQAGKVPAIICQMAIAATALTLTRASNVVFAESSWVPADMQQAAKRCHRIGQKSSVLARVVSLSGSIDEIITGVLVRKTETISKIELASQP